MMAMRWGAPLRCIATAVVCVIAIWFTEVSEVSLRDPRFVDGWILVLGMCVQIAFHIKARTVTGGTTRSGWQRLHIYTGYAVAIVFLSHTSWRLPNAIFEWSIWMVFVLLVLSGSVGTYFRKISHLKLEQLQHRVEQSVLPKARKEFARRARVLILEITQRNNSLVATNFYSKSLHHYFTRPQNAVAHLIGSQRPLRRLLFEIDNLESELTHNETEALNNLRVLVKAKDALDSQHYLEALQKAWLFIHVPATYAIFVLTVLHVVLVYAYSSGVE